MTDLEKASRKITWTLLAGQSLFSAAMIMAFTVGAIIAVELAGGNRQWTGVPSTLMVLGAALMAFPMGRFMDRFGRRGGLSVGYLLGIGGSLVAGAGVIGGSLPLFLLGVFGLGLTKGTLDMGRYAAAEASPLHRRARAISWVVLGGTAGSIVGPSLIDLTGSVAGRLTLPPLSGPWFAAALFFLLSLGLINLLLRPDPQEIGRHLAALGDAATQKQQASQRPYREIWRIPEVKLAAGALIFGQVTMVVVMVVTPVHMHQHEHALASISWVIMAHTVGMFGLSFLTGWLVDRLGRATMILGGGLILATACVLAPLSSQVPLLALALFLLGLGWNFCFVAGSTLLSDVVSDRERGRVQGLVDTMVNGASALGSTGSGFIFAGLGFATMSWLTILIGLVPVLLVILLRPAQPAPQPQRPI